jgi:hypothetical protein
MIWILLPGSKRFFSVRRSRGRNTASVSATEYNEQGFVMLDALLCFFAIIVILLILQRASVSLNRFIFKAAAAMHGIIEERNNLELKEMILNDPGP